jgi:hypothetical protein
MEIHKETKWCFGAGGSDYEPIGKNQGSAFAAGSDAEYPYFPHTGTIRGR